MYAKLLKVGIVMSKYAIYTWILCQSVAMVMATESSAQRVLLEEIEINIDSKEQNKTLKSILKEIETKTDFTFSFSDNQIENLQLSVSSGDWNLRELLKEVSSQTNVSIRRINDYISILPTPEEQQEPDFEEQISFFEVITGKVTDELGDPLIGATIQIKGTTRGTVTDIDGNYSLEVDEGSVLVISYTGFLSREIVVDNQTVINVQLEADLETLQEIVVVGYGTVRKSDLTGAVSSVGAEEIEQVPVLGLDQALQGRAAGVFVSNNNSNPGGQVSIRIRGNNSINGNNEPLFVIDGYIGANINTINPTDIQSMEVLKDASSTAIYGSRGANGVVVITTKSGVKEKSSISFDSFYGWQSITNKLDLLGSREYAEFANSVSEAMEGEPIYTDLDNLTNTDWQDEILRVAPWQNYVLSANGGNGKNSYYLSGGYTKQDGIVESTGFERFNLRANLDSKINDAVKVGARIGFAKIDRTLQDGEDFGNVAGSDHPVISALLLPPTSAVRDADGNLLPDALNGQGTSTENPLTFLKQVSNESSENLINGNVYAEFNIIESLKFRTSVGFDIRDTKINRFKPSDVFENGPASNTNQADITAINSSGWLQENYFTYDLDLGNSDLQLTAGNTLQGNKTEFFTNTIRDFAVNDFGPFNGSAGTSVNFYDTNLEEWTQSSFFGRVNYTLNDKYLFTINGRYDGNSKFGSDNKWGFFPSAAVGWRLIEEDFMNNLAAFSDLKLRASYGISGSEALGPYNSLASLTSFPEAYAFDNQIQVGFWPDRLPNADLGWEQTAQLDIGLDASFLEGRLSLVFDYFKKTTNDLFLNKPVPETSGVSSVLQNIGELENSGIELGIDAVVLDKGDFSWNSSFNITYQESEILDLGGEEEILLGNFDGVLKLGNTQILRVGEQFGSFYGYQTNGTWSTTDDLSAYTQFGSTPEPGDIKFVDVDGNGDVTSEDRMILGQSQPKFFGGFNNTFSYKGFSLSAFMQFATGMNVLNAASYNHLDPGSFNTNKHVDIRNAWTESNQNTDIPKLGTPLSNVVLDNFVEDASFLRLREITLGYNLPSSMLDKLKVSSLRLYVTGTNLLTFTNYSGFDPEVNIGGSRRTDIINTDNGSYPRAKTFITGINLTF